MPRRTNPFQHLCTSIMAAFHAPEYNVEESVLLKNSRTKTIREIDILINHFLDITKNILVECRDHKRKQDVQWIDALYGKALSLGFVNVIAVSSSGFTKPAIEEAIARGIETMHLKEAEEKDWRKGPFNFRTIKVKANFKPHVKAIGFTVYQPFFNLIPKELMKEKMFFVDTKKKIKNSIKDWVKDYQNDPNVLEKLLQLCSNKKINNFIIKIPCDPEIGLLIEPENNFFPLESVQLDIDLILAEYSIPLKHFEIGEKRVSVGDSDEFGYDTRLVLYGEGNLLTISFEQLIPEKNGKINL